MKTELRRSFGHALRQRHIYFLISMSAVLLSSPVHACEDWVAKVVAVEGSVHHKNGQQDWQAVQREQQICPGGSIRVDGNSRASLHLRNNTFTRLDADSLLSFPVQSQERRFWVELRQGLAHFISRIVHEFEVSTPYVNAVVEGTEFVVAAREQGAVSVMEGKVTAYNEKSRASLTAGQQATSTGRDQDLSRFNVPADTLVEWAIHYPPVLSLAGLPAETPQDKATLQKAIGALQQNRIDQALEILDSAPTSDVIQLARANLLLQIGRMPEFTRTIEPLLEGKVSGLAHGLNAIAAIARNDLATGRTSANLALQRAPDSAASWIVLSYAQQAELQLNAALESAQKAVQVQPSSVLGHLRVSELYLAQGDVDAARDALEAVPADVADSAQLEGSKGFVQLFRLKLDSARKHFNRALTMDSSNPQYQLGLGLTLLRDGDLEAGRQHIEYAVSLDPLRSVLRSYLGRAYFEEKRDDEAVEQWQLAKQFDPNDPTPYFYTGVHKLFANDPIGAAEELETSRELNDKRAIYRSETLLQSDAASRSATLARAYDEVGYDQGVLLSGWDAIRRDPTSSEGHRLLADYYAGDPRYETARVSELLQSQLWQPLSAYPLQPQLSEANLAVVAGAGPQRPGFNEYHSLFTQDGVYGMVNGYGGSDGTWGDDLVGSVLAGPFALSLGQYHYESDGWRENADQEQDIYNGLVQWQVTPSTNIQIEAKKFEWSRGDLSIPIIDTIDESYRSALTKDSYRISVRHELDPSNAFVLLINKYDQSEHQKSVPALDSSIITDSDSAPEIFELQYVGRGTYGNILVGLGGILDESDVHLSASDFGFSYFSQKDVQDERQKYTYMYYTDTVFGALTYELGVRYDRLETEQAGYIDFFGSIVSFDDSYRVDQWSPKLGVAWQLSDSDILRLAAYRSFQGGTVGVSTLEPTQVVGFNQFFDDVSASDAKNYAIAYDADAGSIKFGCSVFHRRYDYARVGDDRTVYPSESVGSLYITKTTFNRLVLGAKVNYFDRDFDLESDEIDNFRNVESFALPLFAKLFLLGGWSIYGQATYYDQKLSWVSEDPVSLDVVDVEQEENVWVADIGMRYELPRRIGFVEAGLSNIGDVDSYVVTSNPQFLQFYPERFAFFNFSLNL